MGKLLDGIEKIDRTVSKVSTAAGVLSAAASFKLEGKLIRERDKPGSLSLFGVEIFKRDENLDRTWFNGLIKRGKSGYAKRALAKREGGGT